MTRAVEWPVTLTIGPGLEGAIACESEIGYVNGTKGRLIYRGYDIFDLASDSTFEEVSFLLLKGHLPTAPELEAFKAKLAAYRHVPRTLRRLQSFPVEEMNAMAALSLGTTLLRREVSYVDRDMARPSPDSAITADEDSIPMEIPPYGEAHAIYEFRRLEPRRLRGAQRRRAVEQHLTGGSEAEVDPHLIAAVATIAAAIARLREGRLPVEPDPELSHAGNFLYMITGRRPTPVEERIMDVCLILHADHGMNASTFATMVVASTLSDVYQSIGAGIAALTGPLHGGANEQVLKTLAEIGDPRRVKEWYRAARAKKTKIMGFGHRVYKSQDPRARILAPLARYLARTNRAMRPLLRTAEALEREVVASLGKTKGIYANVDFYSGLVYRGMGIPPEMFTPIFAVARVSGWVARVREYLKNNRIFRPRAMYVGPFDKEYVPIKQRRRPRGKR
ncbi:MAG: citrate synthase [Planctomycetes bacterium DG_58]|nr:MAG: citrate synthase [Planctomycetes bacterium DG_58]